MRARMAANDDLRKLRRYGLNLKELRDTARELAADFSNPPLWTDKTLNLYANEAQLQACRRARLLEDPSMTISVKAANVKNLFAVDPRVIFIRRVKLASQDLPLQKLSVTDADYSMPGWETNPPATPIRWMPWGDHQLKLIDASSIDDTLNLIVVREPLDPLAKDTDAPEIETRYHVRLVDWMLHRMYLSRDVLEKYRPEESADRLKAFEQEFGPPSSAMDEKWISRKHGYDEYEGLY